MRMELVDVMRTTFSARNYTGEALPDELLYQLIDNARFAPSGGNRQPHGDRAANSEHNADGDGEPHINCSRVGDADRINLGAAD